MIIVVSEVKNGKTYFVRAECINTLDSIYLPKKEIDHYIQLGVIYYDNLINSYILRENYADTIIKDTNRIN